MGLLERRAAKAFQDGAFPALKARIDAAAGHELTLDIDWESLQRPGESALYAECWPKVFFEPLIGALEGVAIDDLGKEALRDGLRNVTIRDSGALAVRLEAGDLLVDYPAVANVDDVEERRREIQRVLESGL
jgi:hypothetical protein